MACDYVFNFYASLCRESSRCSFYKRNIIVSSTFNFSRIVLKPILMIDCLMTVLWIQNKFRPYKNIKFQDGLWSEILKSPTIPPTPFLKHLLGQVSWFHWNGIWENITRSIAQVDSYILIGFLEFMKKDNIYQNLFNVIFTDITRKRWHNYPEYIDWGPESSNVTRNQI